MKVVCIKEVECGYVPVTHYKEGDIVEISSIRNGKCFDIKTKSELNMEYFIDISEYRNSIIDNILGDDSKM